MINAYKPQPFGGNNPLPAYVSDIREYVLEAVVKEGYIITLAKMAVGESKSAGKTLKHALFESFTSSGERSRVARARAVGRDSEFIAAREAMVDCGVEFSQGTVFGSSEGLLKELGLWMKSQNSYLREVYIMSQSCHGIRRYEVR